MFDLQLLFFGLWWSLWKKRITIPTPKNWLCGLFLLGWWVSGHWPLLQPFRKKSLQPFRCSRRVDIGRPSRQRTPGPELANGCTRWRNSSNLTFLFSGEFPPTKSWSFGCRWRPRWCSVGWCRRTGTWPLTWMATQEKSGWDKDKCRVKDKHSTWWQQHEGGCQKPFYGIRL